MHKFHKFHTASNHFYLSRPIFFNKTAFDAWPKELQVEMRAAVRDAVTFQRALHVKEEEDAMVEIRKEGGEIVELTAERTSEVRRRRDADLWRSPRPVPTASCSRW